MLRAAASLPVLRLSLSGALLLSLGSAFLLSLGGASAAPLADSCDGLAARIASETGGRVGRRQGPSIDIRAADGSKIDLTCRAEPIAQIASSDATPSAAYFRDLALAAQAIIGESTDAAQGIIAKAYDTARREGRKSFIQQNGWSASCYTDPAGSIRTLCSVGRIPPE